MSAIRAAMRVSGLSPTDSAEDPKIPLDLRAKTREDPQEKRKLDIFRRIEASNKKICLRAFAEEQVTRPVVETSFYRAGFKVGMRFGEGTWSSFLDRFEATVHPEVFARYVLDDRGQEITHEYAAVNTALLRHLAAHEQSLIAFVSLERKGRGKDSTSGMVPLLSNELCSGLVGSDDPVGW